MRNIKNDLLDIFQAALDSVAGKTVVKNEFSLGDYDRFTHFVAIGKAAESMLSGVPDVQIKSALLISKHGHIGDVSYKNKKIICIESDHPVPKESSIEAGRSLLKFLKNLPEKNLFYFLFLVVLQHW